MTWYCVGLAGMLVLSPQVSGPDVNKALQVWREKRAATQKLPPVMEKKMTAFEQAARLVAGAGDAQLLARAQAAAADCEREYNRNVSWNRQGWPILPEWQELYDVRFDRAQADLQKVRGAKPKAKPR